MINPLLLILQSISGGVAGYITNKYAVNMLFKEYTPLKLGGVVKKNKEKFIENLLNKCKECFEDCSTEIDITSLQNKIESLKKEKKKLIKLYTTELIDEKEFEEENNIYNEKIIKGVYIQGMDVSNLTEEEAKNKLQQKAEEIYKKDITLEYKEYNETITPEQIEAEFNFDEAVKEAYSIGKTNNIIIDNFTILKANILKTNIDIQIKYNKEILSDMIKNMDKEIPGAVKEVSYEIDDDKLLITKGAAGVAINEEKLEKQIIENIKNQFNNKEEKEQIPVTNKEEEKINIEQIYKEIYKEPQDAYVEQEPFKLHVEENGLDFAIAMDEAKELLKEEKETYEIPLKITKPKVKTEDLGDKIFKQTLSKYTTIYDAGNTSRSTNIAIATRTINGTIILPGEIFSYN